MFRKRNSLTTQNFSGAQTGLIKGGLATNFSLRKGTTMNVLKDAKQPFGENRSSNGSGKKRCLSEALDYKCTLEPLRKKNKLMRSPSGIPHLPRSVVELRLAHTGGEPCNGLHPEIIKVSNQNIKLTKKMRRIEEMAQFWKRKSVSLAQDLDRSRSEISMLRDKLEGVESQRLSLQSKLLSAQQDSSQCMEAIQSLMSDNENLKFIVKNVNQELKIMQDIKAEELEKCDVSMIESEDTPVDMDTCRELEEALEDTLADLTDRLEEIEQLKKALAKTSVERDQLQRVVSKEVLKDAIAHLEDREVETDPTKLRLQKLQEMVEKCMFRIAVLTQKNEELRKVAKEGGEDTDLLKTLEDSQKLEVLESLCQQRYRALLRKTAAKLVENGEEEDLANQSFFDSSESLTNEEVDTNISFGI